MILEDGTEHQSSLDTALAQPQAQELVKKFIGDAPGRSVTGQAKPLVIILVIILVLPPSLSSTPATPAPSWWRGRA